MAKLTQIGTTKQFETILIESGKYPNDAKVKLGGSDIDKFIPDINISKWNDECWLNFSLDNFAVISQQHNFLNDQVSITVGLVTFFSYVLPGSDNVLEFGIKLSAKPPTNSISFTVSQSPDLIWYKQPALTPEEIAQGDIKSANVVGSYAIYSSTKKNNQYRTGKFGHLYCFEAIDSLGAKRVIEPILSGDKLTLTISQSFLNTAQYPITIMGMGDTFGNTSLGASQATLADYIKGHQATGIAGTLTEIHVGIYESTTANEHDIKCGLYLHSDSSFVSGSKTETRSDIGTTKAWYTFTVPATQPTLSAVDYVIVAWAEAPGAGLMYLAYDNTGAGHTVAATWATDFPTPVTFVSVDRLWSCHAEVTTGGGTLTADVNDSLTLSESYGSYVNPLRTLVYSSLSISESITELLNPLRASAFDTVTLSDFIQSSVTTYGISLYVAKADAGFPTGDEWHTHTDINHDIGIYAVYYISGAVYFIDVFDSTAVNGEISPVRIPFLNLSTSDVVTLTEQVQTLIKQLRLSVSDSVSVLDFISTLIKQLKVTTTDDILISEVASALLKQYNLNVFDSVTITDSSNTLLKQLHLSTFEALAVTDWVEVFKTIISTYTINVNDGVLLSEQVLERLKQLNITSIDGVVVGDSSTTLLKQLNLSVSDLLTITESAIVVKTYAPYLPINVSDTIVLTESITKFIKALLITVQDGILSSDFSSLGYKQLLVNTSDLITLVEQIIVRFSSLEISKAEAITITEQVLALVILPGAFAVDVNDEILLSEELNFFTTILFNLVYDSIEVLDDTKVMEANLPQVSEDVYIGEYPYIYGLPSGSILWKNLGINFTTPKRTVDFVTPELVIYTKTPIYRTEPL